MKASANPPMSRATCKEKRVVKTSLKPSESYHCSSVKNHTIGLAMKKITSARPKSPRPTQKRRGGRGIRISRGSNGPPRSNGSNGRYRRVIWLRSLDGSQSAVVRAEIRVRVRGRVGEVPAHGGAQRLDWVGRGPAEERVSAPRAGGDVLRHRARLFQVFGQHLIRHPHQLGPGAGRLEDHARPHRHRVSAVFAEVERHAGGRS